MADCLRRAIGLPTPPPPCGPVAWWAVDWLDATLEAVCRDPARPWTWARVSGCTRARVRSRPTARGPRSSSWPGQGAGLDWSSIRRHVGAEGGARCPIGPELAAWMDDGMFARWLLGSRPDPVDVVVDLVDLLPAVGHPRASSRRSRRGAAGEHSDVGRTPYSRRVGVPTSTGTPTSPSSGKAGSRWCTGPTQTALNRSVAVKVLSGLVDPVGDQPVRARVRHDRLALGPSPRRQRLRRGHHGRGRPPTWPWSTCPGARWPTGSRRAGRCPHREILSVGVQLCDALDAAHRAGVLHRDIKPENVLVDVTGQCKLADFGVAAVVEGVDSRDTAPGTLLGTVLHLAPEVLEGGRAVGRLGHLLPRVHARDPRPRQGPVRRAPTTRPSSRR